MHLSLYISIGTVLWHGYSVKADYECVCNYGNGPKNVIDTSGEKGIVIGTVNVGSCNEHMESNDQQWLSVIYKHQNMIMNRLGMYIDMNVYIQVGYMINSTDLKVTTYAYDPRPDYRLTSPVTMKTETKVSQTSTPGITKATPISITSSFQKTKTTDLDQVKGALQVCEQLRHQSSNVFANYNLCYELVTDHQTFVNAERECKIKGGHLAHIQNIEEQKFLTKNIEHYVGDKYIWIGLQDTGSEEHFLWTSGEPLSFSNWYPFRKDFFLHGIEDCVAMRTHNFVSVYNGEWDDMPCNRAHSYLCQFDIKSALSIVG